MAFDKLSIEQTLTSSQRLFIEEFMAAAKRLFKLMDVHGDDSLSYRLYDFEVVELNHEVSVLVLVPPAECSCAVPGQKELLLQRGDLISISVQAFEMNHLRTYQSSIIEKYSRLSCILELETVYALHSQREAFSQAEVQTAKERVQKLQELSLSLNGIWKGVRWVMDVIGFARDRTAACSSVTMETVTHIWRQSGGGRVMRTAVQGPTTTGGGVVGNQGTGRHLLELPSSSSGVVNENQQLEKQQQQKAPMKTSPGRGSWPGPSVSDHLFLGDQEHSRSEQQLTIKGMGGSQQYLRSGSGGVGGSRKNSADSQQSEPMMSSSAGNMMGMAGRQGSVDGQRMQSSKSEDTLNVVSGSGGGGAGGVGVVGRKRTTTSSCTRLGRENDDQDQMGNNNEEEEEGRMEEKNVIEARKPTATGFPVVPPRPVTMHSTGQQLHLQVAASSKEGEKKKKSAGDIEFSTIQVYAAYETGLTNGTSLKLHVTTETTSREVVDLVVKQLNMAVVSRGREGPIYTEEDLREFCLVAIIGARERCLRDDFRPLQLQNPWRKGRLYVRKKMDVLAALEHNNQAKMI